MTMTIANFLSDVAGVAKRFPNYPNRVTELNAIATALGTDTTVHDKTIEAPPAALMIGPSSLSYFTHQVNRIVNMGKGGSLTAAAMGTAITSGLATIIPPANTAAPVASGTGTVGQTLNCTNGTWLYSPTTYLYQWTRGGAPIFGATNSSYVLVAADSGSSIACRVTAYNAAGSTTATSNAIACA